MKRKMFEFLTLDELKQTARILSEQVGFRKLGILRVRKMPNFKVSGDELIPFEMQLNAVEEEIHRRENPDDDATGYK